MLKRLNFSDPACVLADNLIFRIFIGRRGKKLKLLIKINRNAFGVITQRRKRKISKPGRSDLFSADLDPLLCAADFTADSLAASKYRSYYRADRMSRFTNGSNKPVSVIFSIL